MIGSFVCSCQTGFFGNGQLCLQGQCGESVCPGNKKCVTPTTIDCECKQGFSLDANGTCLDVNECDTGNSCDPNALCINTDGSYRKRLTSGRRIWNI